MVGPRDLPWPIGLASRRPWWPERAGPSFHHRGSGLFCQSLKNLVVSGSCWCGQLRSGPIAQRWDRHAHAEYAIVDTRDDVIVHEAIQSMHEVRTATERVGAAGSDADLQRQLDRADGRGTARCVDVAGHRSGQENGGRPDERGIDDLEVVVTQGECSSTGGRQRSEPQTLDGIRLLLMRASRATGGPRGHETLHPVVDVVDFE